jgi:hypothetical protein
MPRAAITRTRIQIAGLTGLLALVKQLVEAGVDADELLVDLQLDEGIVGAEDGLAGDLAGEAAGGRYELLVEGAAQAGDQALLDQMLERGAEVLLDDVLHRRAEVVAQDLAGALAEGGDRRAGDRVDEEPGVLTVVGAERGADGTADDVLDSPRERGRDVGVEVAGDGGRDLLDELIGELAEPGGALVVGQTVEGAAGDRLGEVVRGLLDLREVDEAPHELAVLRVV